jgi:hypothetical protein
MGTLLIAPFGSGPVDFYQLQARWRFVLSGAGGTPRHVVYGAGEESLVHLI